LDHAVRALGESTFDEDLLRLEYALSEVCGDHTRIVGFWVGAPIHYDRLRVRPVSYGTALGEYAEQFGKKAEQLGKKKARLEYALKTAEESLSWMANVSRGYLGWLLTNRDFLDEHYALFDKWKEEVRTQGIPTLGPLLAQAMDWPGAERAVDDRHRGFIEDFEALFHRWRLNSLTAPFLPVPLAPQMTGHLPASILRQLSGAGAFWFIPDIFPVPSRDQIRQLLDDSLRGGQKPEHLKEWTAMIRKDNTAKNQIARFARIFELQHFWRLFHQRHAEALYRKVGKLKEAFASFLECDHETIRKDLLSIGKRLGRDWARRLHG
jgi:hypothetical protein